MSRDLPRVPNLDHLKKQAKVLLGELRQLAPTARLADAQRVLARQYGFPSWGKLKAHVERVDTTQSFRETFRQKARSALQERMLSALREQQRAGGTFARYTEASRRAIFFARYEAQLRGSDSIGTQHLLLGLIRGGDDPLFQIFARSGSSADKIRMDVEQRIESKEASGGDVPITPAGKQALKHAAEEADGLGHKRIGTPHLLLALLYDEESVAGSVLAASGMRLEAVRARVAEVLKDFE